MGPDVQGFEKLIGATVVIVYDDEEGNGSKASVGVLREVNDEFFELETRIGPLFIARHTFLKLKLKGPGAPRVPEELGRIDAD